MYVTEISLHVHVYGFIGYNFQKYTFALLYMYMYVLYKLALLHTMLLF